MALASYSDLKTSIANWLARSDLTSEIDDFIDLFEAEFNLKLKHIDNKTSATLTASSTSNLISLPSDFRKLDNLAFNTDPRNIDYIPESLANELNLGAANAAGRPVAFSIISDSYIKLNPKPDSSYTFTLRYYRTLPALGSTNTTNWLLSDNPNLYLYGSLKHALAFISDSQRRIEIKGMYDEAVGDTIMDNFDKKSGGIGMNVTTDTGNP